MKCKACGTENAEGVTICVSCGKRVGGSAGAQVWPKDPHNLTEFKPVEAEDVTTAPQASSAGGPNQAAVDGLADAPVAPDQYYQVLQAGYAPAMAAVEQQQVRETPQISFEPEAVGVAGLMEKAQQIPPASETMHEGGWAQDGQQVEPGPEVMVEELQVEPEYGAAAEEPQAEPEVEAAAEEPQAEPEVEAAIEEPQAEGVPQSGDLQEASEVVGASSDDAVAPAPKKSWRPVIVIVAIAIAIAAIIGVLWFVGQQSSQPQTVDAKSYAGEWVLVEGDEPSLSRSNVAELKDRGLECTLVLKEGGSGTLELFASDSMTVEWSIDQGSKSATGIVEDAGKFDLRLTENGIALVDASGKAMYFERK